MALRQVPASFTAGRPLKLPVNPPRSVTDGVLNSTTTVTSATASFASTDAGGVIVGTGIPAGTTIASVTNSTTVVLSAAATATATGVTLSIRPPATSYAKGASIPNSVVAKIRHVSALLSRGWIVPNVDQDRRRLGKLGQNTPRPQTLAAVERKKLGAP